MSLRDLSSIISNKTLNKIVTNNALYLKVTNIGDEKSIFNDDYTVDNFSHLIKKINGNIEIKSHNLTSDIVFLLENIYKLKDELLLEQSEYLIITKRQFPLIKLTNIGKNKNYGRYIYYDIDEFSKSVKNEYDNSAGFIIIGAVFTIPFCFVLYAISKMKK